MRADLRGVHDLASILRFSYRIYAGNFRAHFTIALITAPLVMLGAVVERRIDNEATSQLVGSLFQIPQALVAIIATAAVVSAVHQISGGARPDAGRELDTGFARFWDVLTSGLLAGVLIVASVAAFPVLTLWWLVNRDATIDGRRDWYLVLVPFALVFYLALRWGFIPQAAVIDGQRRWGALDTSARAVRDNWWRVLGILVVISLLQLGPVLLAASSTRAAPFVEGIVTGLITALILPFSATAQTLLYYDLKARNRVDVSVA